MTTMVNGDDNDDNDNAAICKNRVERRASLDDGILMEMMMIMMTIDDDNGDNATSFNSGVESRASLGW